jgi:hypothetical protein
VSIYAARVLDAWAPEAERGNSVTWHRALCHLAYGFALIVHHPFVAGEKGRRPKSALRLGSPWAEVPQ